MSLFDNLKIKIEKKDGKPLEFKGINSFAVLGIGALVAIVLLKGLFLAGLTFLFTILGFILSPPGLLISAGVAIYVAIDEERRNKFLSFFNRCKKKVREKEEDFNIEKDGLS